jgi:protein SCO1/2
MSCRRISVAAILLLLGIGVARTVGGAAAPGEPPGGISDGGATIPAGQRPEALRDVGFDQRIGEQIPLDLHFRDESGQDRRLGEFFGKRPVVLSLAYFDCPMLCSVVLDGLASSLRTLSFDAGKEFEVLTVSFDPHDTPERAREKRATHLARYHRPSAADGWHFLTGDPSAIDALTRAVGFRYVWDATHQQFAHAAGVVVVTPEGTIARYLYGIEFSARDLRLALIEAAQSRIGSPIDQVLLFCFHYDPVTGRYGRAALDAVRFGGVVTLLAIGGFVATMLWRDRHRERTSGNGGARAA